MAKKLDHTSMKTTNAGEEMEKERWNVLETENQALRKRIEQLERENRQYRDRLEHMSHQANLDYLTGVYNRNGITCKINEILLSDMQQKGALCFLDLDNFKQINDQYGHSYGDEVLCVVARTLQEGTGDTDLVGRFGGDEFLIYMQAIRGDEDVLERTETLCRKIREQEFLGPLTASIGIARCPEDGKEFQKLLDKADTALYQIKCAGKDHSGIYAV